LNNPDLQLTVVLNPEDAVTISRILPFSKPVPAAICWIIIIMELSAAGESTGLLKYLSMDLNYDFVI
jgi:hypothetical protein